MQTWDLWLDVLLGSLVWRKYAPVSLTAVSIVKDISSFSSSPTVSMLASLFQVRTCSCSLVHPACLPNLSCSLLFNFPGVQFTSCLRHCCFLSFSNFCTPFCYLLLRQFISLLRCACLQGTLWRVSGNRGPKFGLFCFVAVGYLLLCLVTCLLVYLLDKFHHLPCPLSPHTLLCSDSATRHSF